MDRRIVDLKSTTFSGKRFTRVQIAMIQETVHAFPALSRRELAHTICEQLQWYTATGKNKIQSCLSALESLEALDILSLPEKIESKKRGPQKKIARTKQTEEPLPINDDLGQLTPLSLQVVTDEASII